MNLDLAGKRVLVLGLGISGRSAARFCAGLGAEVVAADERGSEALGDIDDVEAVATLALGGALPDAAGFDLVVPSPGVPASRYRGSARCVWGDIELAWRALSVPIVAVTGTNGKSTTTRLIEALLRAAGLRAEAAGNIGSSALDLVGRPLDVAVLEVSSFQLETTQGFCPKVALILNITPDHLDRHGSFEAYVAAKARLFANQGPGDWAVVNADDPVVLGEARRARSRKLPFRVTGEPLPSGDGAFFEEGLAQFRLDGRLETLFRRDEVVLPGAHLAGDLLVAAAAARLLGAPAEAIARAVRAFRGVEHVLEHVATIGGVAYYNDSKATNVEAARRSLEAFVQPVLIVLGGRYKGGDFGELAPELRTHGRRVLAIGEARERVGEALGDAVPVDPCSSLREAVERAHAAARPGDVVLLAPACSSFDMFADYADRGRAFKAEVVRLVEAARG